MGLAQTATTAAFTAQTGGTGNQVSTAATFCASTGNTTLGPSSDTAVYQANANQNYGAATGIGIGTGAGVNGFSLLKFSLPALPARCQITSATLTIRANTPTAGATLNAYRANAAWNAATVTWNTGRPGFTGTPAQTASLGSSGPQQWDVTTLTRESERRPRLRVPGQGLGGRLRHGAIPDLGQHGERHTGQPAHARPHLGLTGPAQTATLRLRRGVPAGRPLLVDDDLLPLHLLGDRLLALDHLGARARRRVRPAPPRRSPPAAPGAG